MKKFLLIIFIVFLFSASAYAQEAKYAQTTIETSSVTNENMYWSSSSENYVIKDGKRGIVLGAPNYFMNVIVNSAYWQQTGNAESVAITVEYFDEGTGKFTVRYISETGGNFTSPEIVYMTGTNEWKSHTFYLDDFVMGLIHGNGTINFDIALWASKMGASEDDIAIHSVRIEQCFPQIPVNINLDDYAGNIYGEKDNKVNLSLKNISNEIAETKTDYKIYDSDNNICDEGSITHSLNPNTVNKKDIGIDISKYKFGLYTMDVKTTSTITVNGEIKEFIIEKTFDFSKAKTSEATDEKNKAFNFCTHLGRYDDVKSIEILGRSGAAKIRDEYEWAEVEKTKGQYTLSDDFRKRMKLLDDAGMGYMHILTYGNPLHIIREPYNKMNAPYSDEEIEAYSKYGEYMAKELSNASYFEVWNEYNIPGFNNEERDGAVYAKTLKKTYETIKAINPDVPVVGLAMAGIDLTWAKEVFDAGGYEYMDAVSCHPYDWSGGFSHISFISRLEALKTLMKKYGEEKPILLTEMGWNTSTDSSSVTPQEQAAYAVQMFTMMKAYNLADEVYWYDFQNDGEAADNGEHNFGVVKSQFNDNPLSAKDSFIAICAMNKFMAGNIAHKKTIDKNNNLTTVAHLFEREGRNDLAILWTTKASDTLTLELDTKYAVLYDLYGNKTDCLFSENKTFTLNLTNTPIYLESLDIKASLTDVSYNDKKNILTLSGTASNLETVIVELYKNKELQKSETCNVANNSFKKLISPNCMGEIEIIIRDSNTNDILETKNINIAPVLLPSNPPSEISDGILTFVDDSGKVTVSGNFETYNDSDTSTIIVVPQNAELSLENAVYADEIPLSNGEFSHKFKLPATDGVFDIYLSGTNVYKTKMINGSYNFVKVSSFSLSELNNTLTATAYANNLSVVNKHAVIIIAQYSENGALISAATQNIIIPSNTFSEIPIAVSTAKHNDAVSCTAYIWDSLTNLKPIFNKKELQ